MTATAFPPITVSASASRAILVGLVTRGLTFAGGVLIAHGLATDAMVNQAIDPLSQQIAGIVIATGGAWWGAWYSKHRQSKLVAMADQLPDTIAIVK